MSHYYQCSCNCYFDSIRETDFTNALGIAMECGYDTDCNGATVGSIMGIMIGAKNIQNLGRIM